MATTTLNIVFNVTYYLELCIYPYLSYLDFFQERSNWLCGHYITLTSLLDEKYIDNKKMKHFVNSKEHIPLNIISKVVLNYHNITQPMSCVHELSSRFENKDYGCQNPTASNRI